MGTSDRIFLNDLVTHLLKKVGVGIDLSGLCNKDVAQSYMDLRVLEKSISYTCLNVVSMSYAFITQMTDIKYLFVS